MAKPNWGGFFSGLGGGLMAYAGMQDRRQREEAAAKRALENAMALQANRQEFAGGQAALDREWRSEEAGLSRDNQRDLFGLRAGLERELLNVRNAAAAAMQQGRLDAAADLAAQSRDLQRELQTMRGEQAQSNLILGNDLATGRTKLEYNLRDALAEKALDRYGRQLDLQYGEVIPPNTVVDIPWVAGGPPMPRDSVNAEYNPSGVWNETGLPRRTSELAARRDAIDLQAQRDEGSMYRALLSSAGGGRGGRSTMMIDTDNDPDTPAVEMNTSEWLRWLEMNKGTRTSDWLNTASIRSELKDIGSEFYDDKGRLNKAGDRLVDLYKDTYGEDLVIPTFLAMNQAAFEVTRNWGAAELIARDGMSSGMSVDEFIQSLVQQAEQPPAAGGGQAPGAGGQSPPVNLTDEELRERAGL